MPPICHMPQTGAGRNVYSSVRAGRAGVVRAFPEDPRRRGSTGSLESRRAEGPTISAAPREAGFVSIHATRPAIWRAAFNNWSIDRDSLTTTPRGVIRANQVPSTGTLLRLSAPRFGWRWLWLWLWMLLIIVLAKSLDVSARSVQGKGPDSRPQCLS